MPQWIATLPGVGPRVEHFWTGLGTGDPTVVAKARELGALLIALLIKIAAALSQGLLMVLVSLVFALFFYVGGESLARWLYALAERIGGAQGVEMLNVAGETVRAVVYGIGGTALVQGTLAFLGYWIAGVPYALSLGLVSAVLALVPDGQGLIGFPLASGCTSGDRQGGPSSWREGGKPEDKGPNLLFSTDRLRADWLRQWIATPKQVLPYTAMPNNFSAATEKVFQPYFPGTSYEQIVGVRDAIMNYHRIQQDELYEKNTTQTSAGGN